jgi:hypothetical protein
MTKINKDLILEKRIYKSNMADVMKITREKSRKVTWLFKMAADSTRGRKDFFSFITTFTGQTDQWNYEIYRSDPIFTGFDRRTGIFGRHWVLWPVPSFRDWPRLFIRVSPELRATSFRDWPRLHVRVSPEGCLVTSTWDNDTPEPHPGPPWWDREAGFWVGWGLRPSLM